MHLLDRRVDRVGQRRSRWTTFQAGSERMPIHRMNPSVMIRSWPGASGWCVFAFSAIERRCSSTAAAITASG